MGKGAGGKDGLDYEAAGERGGARNEDKMLKDLAGQTMLENADAGHRRPQVRIDSPNTALLQLEVQGGLARGWWGEFASALDQDWACSK